MTDTAAVPAPVPGPTPDPTPAVPTPAADPAPGGGTAGDPPADKVIWPENWQSGLAGGDEKVAEEMGRYAEPGLIGPALVEAKNKIRSMDVRTPFPDEGSDKDKNKWRKDNGIPKEAAGYFDKLPDGLVIAEEDKQGMDNFAEAMHAVHAPPVITHAGFGAWYKHVDTVLADRAERDKKNERDHGDQHDENYGRDSRGTANRLSDLYNGAGEGVMDAVLDARMANDMKVRDFFGFTKFMAETLYKANPLVTVPGLGGGDPVAALDDEITAIEKDIKNDNRAYRADKVKQARYLTLLEARDKRK